MAQFVPPWDLDGTRRILSDASSDDVCPVCGKGEWEYDERTDSDLLAEHFKCVQFMAQSEVAKRLEQAESEVERLRWMLHDAALELAVEFKGFKTATTTDDVLADLARRYEEAHRD